HDAGGRQEQLLGVHGDMEAAEQDRPGEPLAQVEVARFGLIVGHAKLLLALRPAAPGWPGGLTRLVWRGIIRREGGFAIERARRIAEKRAGTGKGSPPRSAAIRAARRAGWGTPDGDRNRESAVRARRGSGLEDERDAGVDAVEVAVAALLPRRRQGPVVEVHRPRRRDRVEEVHELVADAQLDA